MILKIFSSYFSIHVLITTSAQNDWAIIFSFLHCSSLRSSCIDLHPHFCFETLFVLPSLRSVRSWTVMDYRRFFGSPIKMCLLAHEKTFQYNKQTTAQPYFRSVLPEPIITGLCTHTSYWERIAGAAMRRHLKSNLLNHPGSPEEKPCNIFLQKQLLLVIHQNQISATVQNQTVFGLISYRKME